MWLSCYSQVTSVSKESNEQPRCDSDTRQVFAPCTSPSRMPADVKAADLGQSGVSLLCYESRIHRSCNDVPLLLDRD